MPNVPLTYTPNLSLRTPKTWDRIDSNDFDRFFTQNMSTIDTAIQGLRQSYSTLQSSLSNVQETLSDVPSSTYDDSALQQSIQALGTRLTTVEQNYASVLATLQSIGSGSGQSSGTGGTTGGTQTFDLSGINASITQLNSSIGLLNGTVENYGSRLTALETWRSTQSSGSSGGSSSAQSVDLTPVITKLDSINTTLSSKLGTGGGQSGDVDLSEVISGLSDINTTLAGMEIVVPEGGSSTGGSSGTISVLTYNTIAGMINSLRDNVSSDMAILTNRLLLVEGAAFADMREGQDGKWYAYNRLGIQVDGPLSLGYLNGGLTWKDIFGVVEIPPEEHDEPETPKTWAEIFHVVGSE